MDVKETIKRAWVMLVAMFKMVYIITGMPRLQQVLLGFSVPSSSSSASTMLTARTYQC